MPPSCPSRPGSGPTPPYRRQTRRSFPPSTSPPRRVGLRALSRRRRRTSRSTPTPPGSITPAGSTSFPMATSSWPKTNGPPRPEDAKGIKGFFFHMAQKWAGAGVPSANRITLLRDADGDGVAETRSVFLKDLNSPFGMALIGHDLYVANTDAILRFPVCGWGDPDQRGGREGRRPACRSHQPSLDRRTLSPAATVRISMRPWGRTATPPKMDWTRRIAARPFWKSILRPANRGCLRRACATPTEWLRQPETGVLWTVVNERDELGSDLVPDYLTSVKDGGFYGWPFSYYGQHVDTGSIRSALIWWPKRSCPDYALGNHTASLGLTFAQGTALPEQYRNGAFVGQHGSWNRKPRSGYKVIFVPFATGQPSGTAVGRPHRLQRGSGGIRPPGRRSRSTGPAACWSPTMSATSSGARIHTREGGHGKLTSGAGVAARTS